MPQEPKFLKPKYRWSTDFEKEMSSPPFVHNLNFRAGYLTTLSPIYKAYENTTQQNLNAGTQMSNHSTINNNINFPHLTLLPNCQKRYEV